MEARMTLCNMAVEAGDSSGICAPDVTTVAYLWEFIKDEFATKQAALEAYRAFAADPDAAYEMVIEHRRDLPGKGVIVTRENFGCGSSREHAAWALEVNDINLVIAPSFARIFRQNMFNCGLLAIELPAGTVDHLFAVYADRGSIIDIDLYQAVLTIRSADGGKPVPLTIPDFDRALVTAGGWLEYADEKY